MSTQLPWLLDTHTSVQCCVAYHMLDQRAVIPQREETRSTSRLAQRIHARISRTRRNGKGGGVGARERDKRPGAAGSAQDGQGQKHSQKSGYGRSRSLAAQHPNASTKPTACRVVIRTAKKSNHKLKQEGVDDEVADKWPSSKIIVTGKAAHQAAKISVSRHLVDPEVRSPHGVGSSPEIGN